MSYDSQQDAGDGIDHKRQVPDRRVNGHGRNDSHNSADGDEKIDHAAFLGAQLKENGQVDGHKQQAAAHVDQDADQMVGRNTWTARVETVCSTPTIRVAKMPMRYFDSTRSRRRYGIISAR